MLSNKRLAYALFVKAKDPLPGQSRGFWNYFTNKSAAEAAYEMTVGGPDLYEMVQLVKLYDQVILKKKE